MQSQTFKYQTGTDTFVETEDTFAETWSLNEMIHSVLGNTPFFHVYGEKWSGEVFLTKVAMSPRRALSFFVVVLEDYMAVFP